MTQDEFNFTYNTSTIDTSTMADSITVSDSGTFTITSDSIESPWSMQGPLTTDTITIDTDMRRPLVVGDTELSEDKVKDLLVLLDIIGELDDDNPIKEMFNCKKMLNKIKGEANGSK